MLFTLEKRKANDMKKHAYTLAEVLIALGIIGVIAAVTLPLASKYMPDGYKVLYLKTYDSLMDVTHSIAANHLLYPTKNDGDRVIYTNYPLFNTRYMAVLDGETYGGSVAKYCQLLATSFGDVPTNCSSDAPPNVPNWTEDNISFTATNGVAFMVYTDAAKEWTHVRYKSDVYIDVDGISKGPNCSYDADSCPQPDRFKFEVSSDGKVIASDERGQEYIATRANWRLFNNDLGLPVANLEGDDLRKPLEQEAQNCENVQEWELCADNVVLGQLFKTFARGVYAQIWNPDMGPGNYTHQRHFYYNSTDNTWRELKDTYYVSRNQYSFTPYAGEGAGDIKNINNESW